jgi:hypothetical protein
MSNSPASSSREVRAPDDLEVPVRVAVAHRRDREAGHVGDPVHDGLEDEG